MFIKSLRLQNIRSYEEETIHFSEGTTLLSGDIGSGKTTILLALEYALFGLLRGKTTPAELLRHGAKQGLVELTCEINEREVSITRGLKRGSSAISQLPGKITVDGDSEELVPTELKAKVLTLLGYPESLLSKSINLFRYTVYTPQEQVKHILFETVEERKDIIRKIFNIDKYNIVGTNITYYVGDLRERISRLKGRTDDRDALKKQLASYEVELKTISADLPSLKTSFDAALLATAKSVELLEKKKKEQDALLKEQHQQQLITQQIKQKNETVEDITSRIAALEKLLAQSVVKEITFDKEKLTKVKDQLKIVSEKKSLLQRKYGELEVKKNQATQLVSKIDGMDDCPVCRQDVGSDHKKHIAQEQELLLEKISTKRNDLDALGKKLSDKHDELVSLRDSLLELEKQYVLALQQKKQRELQEEQLTLLKKQKQDVLIIVGELKTKITSITAKPVDLSKEQEDVEKSRRIERQLELQLKEVQTKEQVTKNIIKELEKSLLEREHVAKQIEALTSTYNWVQETFVPLIKTIEKKVLLQVYHEFNSYFIQWFSQLIDDDTITVRLDEDFTPLIEQNGFDTSITNLSGGEKTSVALSYRLALNKVLNNYFGSLHTKGLLILDEPTDGFSAEQLDKLRDVLHDIGVKQLIIVSHEQKLASLADHIIQVRKSGQISIVQG